jgi:MFS family permease
MQRQSLPKDVAVIHGKFFYGWAIVAACALMIAITYGLMYSYSVFFKPLADYFNWDRATVSLIYSASLIIRGAVSIVIGWLADRYGSMKLMVFCGFMIGLGLVLCSQAQTLWQFFLTYAVIEAIGLSGTFGISTAMVSRWFTKNRGLALGIVASGSGLGTLLIVPGTERLINALDWPQAFIICGAISGVMMIAAALFLRPPSNSASPADKKSGSTDETLNNTTIPPLDASLGQALRDSRMILIMAAFLLFFFGIQIIMVHLVNYATDIGVSPLVAATFISVIGAVSIVSRLLVGAGTDKIGIHNSLILTRIFLVISFICLIFTKALWSFYLFAVIFSMPYGGEIPQIPLFISKYFGTRAMATLIGLNLFVITIGGALGAWVAGKIFDNTHSYNGAFIAGALASLGSLILVLILKRQNRATDNRRSVVI